MTFPDHTRIPPIGSARDAVEPRARLVDWLAPALLFGISVAMAAWLSLRPTADRPALAWFSPLLSTDQALAAAVEAGALIVDRGRLPTSVVVVPDTADGLARLHRAGAWMVVDAQGFGGCGGGRQQQTGAER